MVTQIEVCYYAMGSTGNIWECNDFRILYENVRREFRAEMHEAGVYYDYRSAVFYYGILIHEDGHRFRHVSYKEIGYLYVSGCDRRIVSCEFERM